MLKTSGRRVGEITKMLILSGKELLKRFTEKTQRSERMAGTIIR